MYNDGSNFRDGALAGRGGTITAAERATENNKRQQIIMAMMKKGKGQNVTSYDKLSTNVTRSYTVIRVQIIMVAVKPFRNGYANLLYCFLSNPLPLSRTLNTDIIIDSYTLRHIQYMMTYGQP